MIVFIKNIVLRNFEEYLKNRDYLFLEHRKIYVFIFCMYQHRRTDVQLKPLVKEV